MTRRARSSAWECHDTSRLLRRATSSLPIQVDAATDVDEVRPTPSSAPVHQFATLELFAALPRGGRCDRTDGCRRLGPRMGCCDSASSPSWSDEISRPSAARSSPTKIRHYRAFYSRRSELTATVAFVVESERRARSLLPHAGADARAAENSSVVFATAADACGSETPSRSRRGAVIARGSAHRTGRSGEHPAHRP
jgi:hypothetical protein